MWLVVVVRVSELGLGTSKRNRERDGHPSHPRAFNLGPLQTKADRPTVLKVEQSYTSAMGNVAGSSEDEEKAILDHHKQTEDELHQRAAEVGFLRGRVVWFGNFWHDLYYYEV